MNSNLSSRKREKLGKRLPTVIQAQCVIKIRRKHIFLKNEENAIIQGVPHHIRPRTGLNYDFRD